MSGFVKSASMFPYGDLWRIRGDPDVNHVCGGMTSIVLIVVILAICLAKAVQVFRMTTVFAGQTTINDLIPPKVNITTFQKDEKLNPFMLGFSFSTGYTATSQPLAAEDVKATAIYYRESNTGSASSTIVTSPIQLQPCTVQHFSSVPNADTSFQKWGFNRFTCIGLNQTYEIGGQRGFNNNYQSIQLKFQCATSSCNSSTSSTLIFTVITLDTFVNPTNASIPEPTYTTPFTVAFQSKTYNQYNIRLDYSQVQTDSSILPFQQISTHSSVKAQSVPQTLILQNDQAITTVWVQKSNVRTTYDRSFLKLLDAVAYAGGIFQSLLGLFFFMAGFGRFIYEMEFASKFFNTKQSENTSFCIYLKHSAYGILGSFGLTPRWKDVQEQQQYQRSVNRLIDVVHLQKRIAFLQRAIGLLMQKHHLKGLHLACRFTKEEVDSNYRDHTFRSRFLHCLKTKFKYRANAYLPNNQQQGHQNEKRIIEGIKDNRTKCISSQIKEIVLLTNNRGRLDKRERELKPDVQPQRVYPSAASGVQLHSDELYCQTLERDILRQMDGLSSQNDNIYDEELTLQLIQELKPLVDEAQKRNGDPLCKKIKQMIGIQIWLRLKHTIRQVEINQLNDFAPITNR